MKKYLLNILVILLVIALFYTTSIKENIIGKISKSNRYSKECLDLYKKIRYPNKSLIMRPPAQKPPEDMMNDFLMNGKMSISYWYINNAYNDSDSENKSAITEIISTQFTQWLERVRNNQALNYNDYQLNKIMHSYSDFIKNKKVSVIGTQLPWIEAIAYDIGASFIMTLDYTRKKYELPNLKWMHVNDYLEEQLENHDLENFDVLASFSSIEHTGLGRYGDPLLPYGDVDAVKQMHCMLKPGGLLFLGIPTSKDGSSHTVFNAHRIYGKERLDLLFKGWEKINHVMATDNFHSIFILKKIKVDNLHS